MTQANGIPATTPIETQRVDMPSRTRVQIGMITKSDRSHVVL